MKLPKTRIKEVAMADGQIAYCAQYRFLFWYENIGCYDLEFSKGLWEFMTLKKAESRIDSYLADIEYKKIKRRKNKIVKESYREYP